MQRYFIELAYKGTNFHGWQVQKNALTVQEELEKTFSLLLKEKISVTGAGRTDTGVHAFFYIAHFDSLKKNLDKDNKFIYKINQVIHPDISIKKILKVKNEAHARFDALTREYKYFISIEKNPFLREICYEYTGKLDFNKMKESAGILFEYSDFKSFCKLHSDVKTTLCNIYHSEWEVIENKYVYTIKADRFLRNMVRALVGTMFDIGRKRTDIEGFHNIFLGKNRCLAGASAPARGLALTSIDYSGEIFIFN